MVVLGTIIVIICVFVFGGLLGWVLKLLWYVVEFLFEGLTNIFSCLFWIFVGIILLLCVFG